MATVKEKDYIILKHLLSEVGIYAQKCRFAPRHVKELLYDLEKIKETLKDNEFIGPGMD